MKSITVWDMQPTCRCSPTFRGKVLPSSSGSRVSQASNHQLACLAYYSTLKMEAIHSSDTSVNYQTTRRHLSEYHTLYNFVCSFIWA
jgi:hypothetical protein